jgi:hypothetical protein
MSGNHTALPRILILCGIALLLSSSGCFRGDESPVDFQLCEGLDPIAVEFGGERKVDTTWYVHTGDQHFALLYKGDDRAFDFSQKTSIRMCSQNLANGVTTFLRLDKPTEMKNVPGGYQFYLEAKINIPSELVGQSMFIEVLGPNELVVFRKQFLVTR